MKLVRIKRPVGLRLIADKIYVDDYMSKEACLGYLEQMLTSSQEDMFVIVLLDGDVVKGFLIAMSYPNQPFSFLYQAWSTPDAPREWKHKMFKLLLQWTDNCGKLEIRTETQRDVDAIYRAWGFKERSVILSRAIDNSQTFEPIEEPTDGRQQQTRADVNTVTRATEGCVESGGHDREVSGGGIASVPRSDGSGPVSSDAPSSEHTELNVSGGQL